MVDDMKKSGLADSLLDSPNVSSKLKQHRMTVATTDGRMAKKAIEMRNKRASTTMNELRSKRASVATSDARLMEQRRDDAMEKEFVEQAKQNRSVEKAMGKSLAPALKKIGRRMSAMAGQVVEEVEDEIADAEGQSNSEAVLNMLNNALGTGMLALACVMMKVGLYIGLGTMIFSCCLNCFTILVHVDTCRIAGCDPAGATLGEIACGRPGFLVMTVVYVIICFASMVSYVDASADAMKTIFGIVYPAIEDMDETMFKICNWAICLVPGTFIRDLGGVAIMSFISFIGALLVLMTILVRCGGGLVANGLPASEDIQWWPSSVANLLSAAPVLILCYALQAGGGIVIGGLKDNSTKNQKVVCCGSFGIVLCLEIVVACCSYLFFLKATPPDVMTVFPATDVLANTGRLGVLAMVICGYVMLNVPTRVMLIQLLFNKNESNKEASYFQFVATNIGVSVLALVSGLLVSNLSAVLGICGAVATPLIAFILPALFTIRVRAKSDDAEVETPILSLKQWDMYLVLAIGIFFWISFCAALGLSMAGYEVTNDWTIAKMH